MLKLNPQGQEFFVPQNLNVRDVESGTILRLPSDNAELFFDAEAESPDRIALLSSQFPAPTTGLSEARRRVSPVYTIDAFPIGANLAADLNRTTTVAVEKAEDLPTGFRLEQNYPNPFNPVTTIVFTIPDPAHVRLTVYDVQGREIQVLVDGLQPTGTHQVHFDARNLPSGAYFYRLTAGGSSQTRTMVLLR